jgi:hypothetical protein
LNLQVEGMFSVLKLLIIFTALTLLFYGMIIWIAEMIQPHQRYESPRNAVKVFHSIDEQQTLTYLSDYKERLMFFIHYGE